jgi:hypothetical protein
MESVFAALKETPIPTILVIAGIAFLLLSIAGQLAGRITVPPEQRRQAKIMGYLLVVVGVALHVVPLTLNRPKPPEAPPQTTPPLAIKPNEPSPSPSPALPRVQPPPSVLKSPVETGTTETETPAVQTTARGVVASITRFQKSGDLVTMEIMLRNTSSQDVTACIRAHHTELIDQATGESWRAALHAGRECNVLDANKSGRVWMKFEIRAPEGRTFALSSPLLKETLEHLVLREPS